MFNFLRRKGLNNIFVKILNSKSTYIFIIILMLIQFFLVSIIFFQNKNSKYLTEQTNFRVATIENQQKQLNEKLNSLQSNIMRLSSILYRLQPVDNNNN